MTEVAVYTADLLTGRQHRRLPVSSVTFTEILSSPGSFEAVIPVKSAVTAGIVPDMIAESRTSLWIERDSVLLFAGIIWTSGLDADGNYVTIRGEGFHSYLRHRNITETLIFNNVEQQSIAAQIITYSADPARFPNGDVGIRVPATFAATTARSITYSDYELQGMGDAVEQIAANQGGFDFRYLPYLDPADSIRRVMFTPVYPLTGKPTAYVFTLQGNCRTQTAETDGTVVASEVWAVGGGEAEALPRVKVVSSRPGPLLQLVDNYSDVTDPAVLQSKAALRLQQSKQPVPLPSITVDPDADPPLGSYGPGDIVRVRGRYGLSQVDDDYKIQQQTYTVNDTEETVTLQVAQIGAFQDETG